MIDEPDDNLLIPLEAVEAGARRLYYAVGYGRWKRWESQTQIVKQEFRNSATEAIRYAIHAWPGAAAALNPSSSPAAS